MNKFAVLHRCLYIEDVQRKGDSTKVLEGCVNYLLKDSMIAGPRNGTVSNRYLHETR